MRYSLLGLLALVLFVAISCAALIGAVRAQAGSTLPYWWSTGVISATVVLLVLCVLGTIFSTAKSRCAWAGALVIGLVYWALIFSSWFSTSVGTRLVTTRAILWIEQKLAPRDANANLAPPMAATSSWNDPSANYTSAPLVSTGSTGTVYLPTTAYPPATVYTPATYTRPSGQYWPLSDVGGPPGTPFQEIFHYLLIWPLAAAGAVAAGWLYSRSRRTVTTTGAPLNTAT